MTWLNKKKAKPKKEFMSDDYGDDEETDEDTDFEEDERQTRTITNSITNSKPSQVQMQQQVKSSIEDDMVIPFMSPAREGMVYKGSRKIVAENIWDAMCDIKNQLNRIEKEMKN